MTDEMTIDGKIEVLQACKRGETIQMCGVVHNDWEGKP